MKNKVTKLSLTFENPYNSLQIFLQITVKLNPTKTVSMYKAVKKYSRIKAIDKTLIYNLGNFTLELYHTFARQSNIPIYYINVQ